MASSYQDLYSWSYFRALTDSDVLIHTDNSVSVAFRWNGIQTNLKSQKSVENMFQNIYDAFHDLPDDQNVVIENHFIREYSDKICSRYIEYGEKNAVRNTEFGLALRKDLANTISNMSMENKIITVITIERRNRPLDALFPKKANRRSSSDGEKIINLAWNYMAHLDGAEILPCEDFESLIWRTYHRDRNDSDNIPSRNDRFKIRDRIANKPIYTDSLLKLGDTYTKVLLLLDYPDAGLNWFKRLSNVYPIEMHVTQIVKPIDVGLAMSKSATQTERSADSASQTGGEETLDKVKDHNTYRKFISGNNLHAYKNAYIIKLHCPDSNAIKEFSRTLLKELGEGTVLAPDSEEMAFVFWRVSQLAQGHRTPFLREDHTLQVANMAPLITFSKGDENKSQMLRVTKDAQAVTLAYPEDGTNHTITIAKTGSGKGVETVTQIAELYPLGTNFYGAEVGASYKWVVEAFDGDYFHLNPNTVISPFPNYSLADRSSKNPLSADIIAPTIGAITPLIGAGGEDIQQHIESVGEQIMAEIYRHDAPEGLLSPTLATFFDASNDAVSHFSGVQNKAAQIIVENLDSFLSSTTGSNFERADSLDFTKGIVFVDFKGLMNNPRLSKFLLVFVAMRFKQLAFANSTPTRILLDELHEFSDLDRMLVKNLIRQLTRMGRKEAGAFHGITQENQDVELEKGILNQITNRNFMFLQDGHDEVAKIFKMNDGVLSAWESYRDPEAPGANMNFRQNMRMMGEQAFDMHLKFPQSLLDLAHSSPKALEIKDRVGKITSCPFERLRLFREEMAS